VMLITLPSIIYAHHFSLQIVYDTLIIFNDSFYNIVLYDSVNKKKI